MCFWSRKCRVDCGFFIARERVVSTLNELVVFLPFPGVSCRTFIRPCFAADVICRGRFASGASSCCGGEYSAGETPTVQPAGLQRYCFAGTIISWTLQFRRRTFLDGRLTNKKENRAGWPGSFCVELDAVTSQRGATGAEGMHLCASDRSQIERSGAASGNRLWLMQAACHASICFDLASKRLFLLELCGN
jgi:hypothetical protein